MYNQILFISSPTWIFTASTISLLLGPGFLKNSTIFAFIKDNLNINDDSLSVINTPIIFEEFLKQVKKNLEKIDDGADFLKIGRFSLNYNSYELTDNLQNNVIRLTELESKFLKFIS